MKMKETLDNLKPVWHKETEKMVKDFQKFFDSQEQKDLKKYREEGGTVYVKARFIDKKNSECMWVQVKDINLEQKFMYGRLANSPVFIKNIKCGDWVNIKFKDIISLKKENN